MKPLIMIVTTTIALASGRTNEPTTPNDPPRRRPEATRPMFDLIRVEGNNAANLSPYLGVERLEGGFSLIDNNNAWPSEGSPGVWYRVDPLTDYTVRVRYQWLEPGADGDAIAHDWIEYELECTRELELEWYVYESLRTQRELFAHIHDEGISAEELAFATQRMSRRLDMEGDTDD